jgi:glycosyltransferase involved in cell wall biosynthesis
MADYFRVGVLSLETWDDVWRRNQHLASQLVRSQAVTELDFVTPPSPGLALRSSRRVPEPGIVVRTPPLIVPRSYGGHRLIGGWLRRRLRDVDVLWVNDPVAGAGAMRAGQPVVYDVTDDWRSMPQTATTRARIIAAEDLLAQHADATVVCSAVLATRWRERYGITAAWIPNGVDVEAIRAARARQFDGDRPAVVYVGTVHNNRVDIGLVSALAAAGVATMHLVGPDRLTDAERGALTAHGVRIHGPVPASEVPSWLVAADVLICPHLVDDFTLSLDAIKAHEYLATDRPVVATPSCGFQNLSADGLSVVPREEFVAAMSKAIGTGPFTRTAPASWAERAAAFAGVLRRVAAR